MDTTLFGNVEKFSRDIASFGNFKLTESLVLSTRDAFNGRKRDNIYSYNYQSSKYTDYSELLAITATPSIYLMLSYRNIKSGLSESASFSIYEMYYLKRAFKEVRYYFENPDEFYIEKENREGVVEIKLLPECKKKKFTVNGCNNSQIMMRFSSIRDNNAGRYEPVLVLYINTKDTSIVLNENRFLAICDIIVNYNISQQSLAMLNFVMNYMTVCNSLDTTDFIQGLAVEYKKDISKITAPKEIPKNSENMEKFNNKFKEIESMDVYDDNNGIL